MCKAEQLIDIRSGVDRFRVELAGIGRRFAARFLDGLVFSLPVLVPFFIIGFPILMRGGTMPWWIRWGGYAIAPVYIVYEALMLRARGQTLGKIALNIKVVQPGGIDITAKQAWGRSVVRGIFVSAFGFIDYLPALFTREKTCLHDMAAKTRVVVMR